MICPSDIFKCSLLVNGQMKLRVWPSWPLLLTRDQLSDPQTGCVTAMVPLCKMVTAAIWFFGAGDCPIGTPRLHPGTSSPPARRLGSVWDKPDPYSQDGDEIVTTIAGFGSQRLWPKADFETRPIALGLLCRKSSYSPVGGEPYIYRMAAYDRVS